MIDSERMTDQEITTGIKRGNLPAYKQLFLKYYVPVRRFLTVILSDFEMAQDISQDIFMKVWLNRDNLSEGKSIKSLVYTMAKNTAINHLRREGGKRAEDVDNIETCIMPASEVSGKVDVDSLKSYLFFRISQMPDRRRTIFLMSRCDGMKNKEIATQLGISVRTVEKHIELALRELHREEI